METRPAEPEDKRRIRAIASDSFQSSYALSPQQIETVLEAEFSESQLEGYLDSDSDHLFVAEGTVDEQDGIHGFLHARTDGHWTIRWLHVDPEARGREVGTTLVERLLENVESDHEQLRAWVLDQAVEGGEFCTRYGLNRDDNDWAEFGNERFAINIYTATAKSTEPNEPSVELPETVTISGAEHNLLEEEPIPGHEAPFFRIENGSDEPVGYFCSQCGSTDVSADGLDRLLCGNCGNLHRADEWDGAYL